MYHFFKSCQILIFFLVIVSVLNAAIPRTITYQGLLTDQSGNPVSDDNHTVVFSLYDAKTAGNLVWGEETHTVTTSKGIFTAQLGSVNSLAVPFDKQYWIEIKVNTKIVSPRVLLSANAYAFRADTADVSKSVVGLSGLLNEKASATHQHSSLVKQGSIVSALVVDTAGKIGIGTDRPQTRLHLKFPGDQGVWSGLLFSPASENSSNYQSILGNYGAGLALSGGNISGDGYPRSEMLMKADGIHFFTGSGDSATKERCVFLNNGNVGIGTTTPTSRLFITSTLDSVPTAGLLRIGTYDYSSQPNNVMLSVAPGVVNVDAPGVAGGRLKIDKKGNVGIGTTSPQSLLHLKSSRYYGGFRISPNADGSECSLGFYQDASGIDSINAWVVGQGLWGG